MGYSGWDFDQLNEEIEGKNWIIQNLENTSKLLSDNMDCFWKESLNKLGGHYQIWSNSPENPSYN